MVLSRIQSNCVQNHNVPLTLSCLMIMELDRRVDEDGFCVVSRKKGKKRGITSPKGDHCHRSVLSMKSDIDAPSLTAKINQCVGDLQISRFYCQFKETWHSLQHHICSHLPQHNISAEHHLPEGLVKDTSIEGIDGALQSHLHATEEDEAKLHVSSKQADHNKDSSKLFAEAEDEAKRRHASAITFNSTTHHSTDLIPEKDRIKQSDKQFEKIVERGEEKPESAGVESTGMLEDCFGGTLTAKVPEDRRVKQIVCYGLGNFSSCVTARFQLALLILLNSLVSPENCFLFDPNFTDVEKQVLEELGYCLINKNEEGKHQSPEPTLFFMPHCGKPLYNNLLWANWGQKLSNLVILGNSFDNFSERFTVKQLKEEVPYIHKIIPYHSEVSVRNIFQYTDIFNDMAFQFFPMDLLRTAPSTLWMDKPQPSYDHISDVEIITASSMS